MTELFNTPQPDRLRALPADVLVIAYHSRIDLRYKMSEVFFEGFYDNTDRETAAIIVVDLNRKTIVHGSSISFYDNTDRETAAIIVVDLNRKTIVHGSSISFEDNDAFAHIFWIVPMIMSSREPFDICNTVARQAGGQAGRHSDHRSYSRSRNSSVGLRSSRGPGLSSG